TGGKDYKNPLWNLTTLCATFMEKGDVLAHKFAEGYTGDGKNPGYIFETTQALYERKLRERETKNLGWPGCDKIRAAGCESCASCPHFSKGKSPLNLALPTSKIDAAASYNQVKEGKLNPVIGLMTLRDQGADVNRLLLAMNENFAVAKYGGQIAV